MRTERAGYRSDYYCSSRREEKSSSHKRTKNFRKKLSLLCVILAVTLCYSTITISAHNFTNEQVAKRGTTKMYKSYQISSGETLWDVASEFCDDNYDSFNEYIDEVISINKINGDKITEGMYLTVPYYE